MVDLFDGLIDCFFTLGKFLIGEQVEIDLQILLLNNLAQENTDKPDWLIMIVLFKKRFNCFPEITVGIGMHPEGHASVDGFKVGVS